MSVFTSNFPLGLAFNPVCVVLRILFQSCFNMQDIFSLTWENFSSNILQTFKGIKKSGQLHDVTLVCKDGEINAHKLILFGGSNFFQSVFTKNNHQHPLIYLKGIKAKNMEAILDFLYNGEVRIAEEDLKYFLETAEDLEINGLFQKERIKDTEQNIKIDFYDIDEDIADSIEVLKRSSYEEQMGPKASYTKITSDNGKEQNIKEDFHDIVEDIADSTEVFKSNIHNEQMGPQTSTNITGDNGKNLLRLDNNPNKIMTVEKCEKGEVDNDIVLHDILHKYENLESDETLELMEKGIEPDGTRVWKCKLCDKRNSDKTRIRKHIRGQHLKNLFQSKKRPNIILVLKIALKILLQMKSFRGRFLV